MTLSPDSKIVIDSIERALNSVGSDDFHIEWMEALKGFFEFDHFSILYYSKQEGSRILLSHGGYGDDMYDKIASEYERECSRDPHFRRMLATSPFANSQAIHIPLSNFSDREYVHYFYNRLNIIDKCSLIYAVGTGRLLTGFYRFSPSSLFTRKDWKIVEEIGPIFNRVAVLHFQLTGALPQLTKVDRDKTDLPGVIHTSMNKHRKQFKDLSERERDICEFILLGFKTDDIAAELNIAKSSVTTYRKRAYAKLGISSQKELFHILLK